MEVLEKFEPQETNKSPNISPTPEINYDFSSFINENRWLSLENLHGNKEFQLTESLSAITTHFVHVQFRLRQIIDAPLEEKESLLKDLEEFAFKGIPETQNIAFDPGDRENQFKDKLITNLKNQITELENIIKNLRDSSELESLNRITEDYNVKNNRTHDNTKADTSHNETKHQSQHLTMIKKMFSVLHLINIHCKEGKDNIKRDFLNKQIKYNHWGDARAQLEIAISEVLEVSLEPELPIDSDYMSDSEGGSFYVSNQKLTSVVRKKLAPAIQNLIQHGLLTENKSLSMRNSITLVIGCVPYNNNSSQNNQTGHAWELILKYYKMKNGDQFNSEPALKLSQSYNLDVGRHSSSSSFQKLLITIGNIMSTHSLYKRSFNSQFKAFICAALNAKMLVTWLQLIYRSKPLIEIFYEPWSYSLKPGFEDSYKSLEKLQHFHFNLPVDVAIQQLENIKDAF